MQDRLQDEGLTLTGAHDSSHAEVSEPALPSTVAHNRSDDEFEASSIKWNVARIVRLSSGRFALLTHYRAGALDIIKVGTIEEITPFIPTAEQCIPDKIQHLGGEARRKLTTLDLADLGL